MAFDKCPGQDIRRKKQEDILREINCPQCGYSIEFFFDDLARICPQCGEKVEKGSEALLKDFGCATWCSSALECLGPRVYEKFNEFREALIEEKKKKLRELLSTVPDEEIEVKLTFIRAFQENTSIELLINPERTIKPLRKKDPRLYEKVIRYYSEFTRKKKKE